MEDVAKSLCGINGSTLSEKVLTTYWGSSCAEFHTNSNNGGHNKCLFWGAEHIGVSKCIGST